MLCSVVNAPLKSCFRFGRGPPLCSRTGIPKGAGEVGIHPFVISAKNFLNYSLSRDLNGDVDPAHVTNVRLACLQVATSWTLGDWSELPDFFFSS